jgi:endonuclease-3
MTSVSRSAQFGKVHKILKKHYKPVAPRSDRSVLEHLMFACCLEDASYEAAEEAFAALVHTFFDWNEVRVTSLSELSEVMAGLPDPRVAGNRIKRILHGIFEAAYSFDMEDKRKKNLGPTVKWLEKIDGATGFTVAYVVQAALGGHQIAIDAGTMAVLRILDLVTDKDAEQGAVPGLERAIPKSKGVEFASLLHQFGADFTANPFSPAVRDILLQIEPSAKERFPHRRAPKEEKKPEDHAEVAKRKSTAAAAAEKSAEQPAAPAGRKKGAAKSDEHPRQAAQASPAEESGKTAHGGKRAAHAPSEAVAAEAGKKKSTSEGLGKRKPR